MIDIDKTAFDLFRLWTKNAKKDKPTQDFTIIDETSLVQDLKNALNSSIESLWKKERREKRAMSGYDYGFVIGFIQGNLNTHWFNEYITKRTDLYKGFMINKAILSYLEFDNITNIRIHAIYESLLQKDLNLDVFDFSITEKEFEKHEIDEEVLDNTIQNTVRAYLKNQIKEQVIELFEAKAPDYLNDIDGYFKRDYVKELIKSYEI